MRTGLKTFYKQKLKNLRYPEKLPQQGWSNWKTQLWLLAIVSELREEKLERRLGALHCRPDFITLKTWRKLLRFNPNNMGNWSVKSKKEMVGSKKIERKLIKLLINFLGGRGNQWEGYVTTGATEAGIFSGWIGRKVMENKFGREKICVLVSSLSHYSIEKMADLIGLKTEPVVLNRKEWRVDTKVLERRLRQLYVQGFRGFLVPLTLGYTQTGTNDNIGKTVKCLSQLKEELGIDYFVWIDGATNGLVMPFIKNKFLPLRNGQIKTFYLDFHKTGMGVLPCGVVLYRKSLRRKIEKPIAYVHQKDNTLLGSRSGIAPVAAYLTLLSLGKKGFRRMIKGNQQRKQKFIKMVQQKFLEAEVVDESGGVAIGLVSKKPLPKSFLRKHGLFAKKHLYRFTEKKEWLYIYKAFFLNQERGNR